VALCLVLATFAEAQARLVFTGRPTLIVVSGYSTSATWPRILQRKLDRYYGGKRVVEVKSAIVFGTPIAKLIDLRTGRPKGSWNKVRGALASKGGRPAIAIAQQSLQWAFGPREAGIRSATDYARIQEGARVIGVYANLLQRYGADYVIMSTHVYKREMEPEIGNERYALQAYARKGPARFSAGPNTWQATRAYFPSAYVSDQVHLSYLGAEIVAQAWFAYLLGKDGLAVPSWSVQELQAAKSGKFTAPARSAGSHTHGSRPGKRRVVQETVER
jgi:hypothetical protein